MMEITLSFPRIFRRRVSFPGNKIAVSLRVASMRENLINFVFFFSTDKVRWWFSEIQTMFGGFPIGG
jgi:hypothetical protein